VFHSHPLKEDLDMKTSFALLVAFALVACSGPAQPPSSLYCPDTLSEAGLFANTAGSGEGLEVVGTTGYLANGGDGLRVIDLSNLGAPVEVGVFPTTGASADDIVVDGGQAFLAANASIVSLDVSSDTPSEIGRIPAVGSSVRLALLGDRLVVAENHGGMRVIDVTDPAAPTQLGSLEDETMNDLVADGDYAYVNGAGEVRILDISDPSMPAALASYRDADPAAPNVFQPGSFGLAISGSTFYFGNGVQVYLLDVTDPAAPVKLSALDVLDDVTSSALDGGCLYVGYGDGGISAIDVSDSAAPKLVSTYRPDTYSGAVRAIVVQDDVVYATEVGVGLHILQ